MKNKNELKNTDILFENEGNLMPGLSLDNVIFGFHEGILKILLNKFDSHNQWMLPGGFIYRHESVDDAAYRILSERTGLKKIFLTQFHIFGDPDRTNMEENKTLLQGSNISFSSETNNHWLLQRFISIGYYAFVEYSQVKLIPKPDEQIQWFDVKEIPDLYSDHNKIITTAISNICQHIGNIPIGYELLPEKFTMTELRLVYEAFLNEKLDRRNFQRKILASKLLIKLNEKSKRLGVKPSTLYSFDTTKLTH